MIRARLQMPKGRKGMLIGLSGENVTRLVAGEPILHQMDDAGFPKIDLIVVYGKTEDDIKEQLAKLGG